MSQAQVFRVQAGASSLQRAAGTTVHFWSRGTEGWVAAGASHGAGFGGYLRTTAVGLRNAAIELGDIDLSLRMPTDILGAAPYLPARGIGVSYKGPEISWRVYGGATAEGLATAYYRAARLDRPVAYVEVDARVTSVLALVSRTALSNRKTSLHGLRWTPLPGVEAGLAGGVGGSESYFAASLALDAERVTLRGSFIEAGSGFRRQVARTAELAEADRENVTIALRPVRGLAVTLGRQNFRAPPHAASGQGPEAGPPRSTINHASVSVRAGRWRGAISGYYAPIGAGRSRGVSAMLGATGRWLDSEVGLLESDPANGASSTILMATLRERLSPRLEFLQVISGGDGPASVSFGGKLLTNPVRASVEYRTIFLPVAEGWTFRNAMLLSLELQPFGNLRVTAGTQLLPDGSVHQSIQAGTFLYAGDSRPPRGEPANRIPPYIIRGQVLDESGAGVAGAAVRLGEELVFSDTRGQFFVRSDRNRAHTVEVLPDEFTMRGRFVVVDAPDHATPAPPGQETPITIVVRKVGATR
ncbi:MAG: carboxypeptidase-like regulatory domain-containing protein [Gemmatimonadetes bacterium]|nr:carboxypeptidase-like regulatory domain-containing protein [Gemmatimonadota bacterium]